MLDLKLTDALPLDSILSMRIILSHGKVRSRLLFLDLLLKLNIVLWHREYVKFFDFDLFNELGFMETNSSQLFCDNKSAIMFALDSVLHKRSKHIEVDINFIQENVRSGIIISSFVPSSE